MKFFRSQAGAAPSPGTDAGGSPHAAAGRPRLAGFDEQAMLGLYSAATVRRVGSGEIVVRQGDPLQSLYVVADGVIELTSTDGDHPSRVALLTQGDCLGTLRGAGASPCAYQAAAIEPSTLVEISPAAFHYLSQSVQQALARSLGSSTAARFDALVPRHGALARQAAQLVAQIQEWEQRSAAALAARPVQDAIAGMPRLPAYATDLAAKLLDDDVNVDEVVESIKNDPALAAMVLKTVNSAYYGLPTKVSDYYHALLHLGTNAVYQLVLESGLESVMPDTEESRQTRAHSYLISVISHEVARLTTTVRPQLATTVGLLHSVGKSVVPVLKEGHPDLAPLIDLLDASKLGARLLASWGLPARVFRVIEHQRDPEFSPPDGVDPDYRNEVAVLYLARVYENVLSGRPRQTVQVGYADQYLPALGITGTGYLDLYRERVLPAVRKRLKHLPAALRHSLPAAQRSEE